MTIGKKLLEQTQVKKNVFANSSFGMKASVVVMTCRASSKRYEQVRAGGVMSGDGVAGTPLPGVRAEEMHIISRRFSLPVSLSSL